MARTRNWVWASQIVDVNTSERHPVNVVPTGSTGLTVGHSFVWVMWGWQSSGMPIAFIPTQLYIGLHVGGTFQHDPEFPGSDPNSWLAWSVIPVGQQVEIGENNLVFGQGETQLESRGQRTLTSGDSVDLVVKLGGGGIRSDFTVAVTSVCRTLTFTGPA